MFIVPTNDDTRTIDYNIRMVITDNELYPKVYEVTKVTDTSYFGCSKVILKQVHYNAHTDLCGKDINHKYFTDDKIHMIGDFYKLSFTPDKDKEDEFLLYKEWNNHEHYLEPELYDENLEWTLEGSTEYIYVDSINPVVLKGNCRNPKGIPKWYFYIDDKLWTERWDDLSDYFEIKEQYNTFSIRVINKTMINYVLKIGISDISKHTYDNFTEMEVCR